MSDIEAKLRQQIVDAIESKKAERAAVDVEIEKLNISLTKFNEIFGVVLSSGDATSKAKKTTAKKAAKKTTAAPKDPSASAATEDAGSAAEAAPNLAAQGRREVASGKRPKIKEAMVLIMGDRVMNADGIVAELASRGWTPKSKNPKVYISYLLSSIKDQDQKLFDKVPGQRGFYKVRADVVQSGLTSSSDDTDSEEETAPEVETKAAPPAVVEEPTVEIEEDDTDAILADVGLLDVRETKAASATSN